MASIFRVLFKSSPFRATTMCIAFVTARGWLLAGPKWYYDLRHSLGGVRNITRTAVHGDEEGTTISRHVINWYPGHIAKAEKELQDYLKLVDVVIEARDARIPAATTHPLVRKWVGKRPLIVTMTRRDMASPCAMQEWSDFHVADTDRTYNEEGKPKVPIVLVNAKEGKEVYRLKQIALKAGSAVNRKRRRLGLLPRSIRCAVIGYPNVGKSALINKLIGRPLAKSKNLPGVTKRLQWIRLGQDASTGRKDSELELLDSPGIIPAKQVNQETALKLAVCNDIGQASYDVQVVAGGLIDLLKAVHIQRPSFVDIGRLSDRYRLDLRAMTGDEYVLALADKMYRGNAYSAADRLLADFRKGVFGPATLEVPPSIKMARVSAVCSIQLKPRKEATKIPEDDYVVPWEADGPERNFRVNKDDVGKFEGW